MVISLRIELRRDRPLSRAGTKSRQPTIPERLTEERNLTISRLFNREGEKTKAPSKRKTLSEVENQITWVRLRLSRDALFESSKEILSSLVARGTNGKCAVNERR